MIEQIKAVNNPLTIIAIFAGLAEVASIVALRYVNPDLQYIFLWFVMGFPVLLVVLFFLTLNFNPKVLYAPSDFKDDESFLQTLNINRVATNLDEIQNQLESAKSEIVSSAIEEISKVGKVESAKISEIVSMQLNPVQKTLEEAIESVDHFKPKSLDSTLEVIQREALQIKILHILRASSKMMTFSEISQRLGDDIHQPNLRVFLVHMVNRGLILQATKDNKAYFGII